MKLIFEEATYNEILARIDSLNANSDRQWGKMEYKHVDHHLTQFGV